VPVNHLETEFPRFGPAKSCDNVDLTKPLERISISWITSPSGISEPVMWLNWEIGSVDLTLLLPCLESYAKFMRFLWPTFLWPAKKIYFLDNEIIIEDDEMIIEEEQYFARVKPRNNVFASIAWFSLCKRLRLQLVVFATLSTTSYGSVE
jgi:hypothetical protein